MSIPTFVPGYPPDGSSLGQTKTTIRNNIDGTFQTVGVDHVDNNGSPGSQPPGYHTIVHQVSQTSVSTVAGYNQVFAGVPGTLQVNASTTPNIPSGGATQLYSLTGGGTLSQLTGHNAAVNGYQWVGGLLFQWGRRNLTGAQNERATILFATANVNFPNNVFSMQISLICKAGGSSSSDNTISIVNGSISNTAFQYNYSGSGGSNYPALYWLAIGN